MAATFASIEIRGSNATMTVHDDTPRCTGFAEACFTRDAETRQFRTYPQPPFMEADAHLLCTVLRDDPRVLFAGVFSTYSGLCLALRMTDRFDSAAAASDACAAAQRVVVDTFQRLLQCATEALADIPAPAASATSLPSTAHASAPAPAPTALL